MFLCWSAEEPRVPAIAPMTTITRTTRTQQMQQKVPPYNDISIKNLSVSKNLFVLLNNHGSRSRGSLSLGRVPVVWLLWWWGCVLGASVLLDVHDDWLLSRLQLFIEKNNYKVKNTCMLLADLWEWGRNAQNWSKNKNSREKCNFCVFNNIEFQDH